MTLEFLKVEGLGNDFLLVDRRARSEASIRAELEVLRAQAPRLCDRRRGVGGDGILIVAAPRVPGSDASMIVINHDGSVPEMCGNGLRCVAAHVGQAVAADCVRIDTDSGTRVCSLAGREPSGSMLVRVDMGPGRDLGTRTPSSADFLTFRAISMGNPHAVAFVGAEDDPEVLARSLGPSIERDPAFPDGTNVEFARHEPDGTILLWVWERGCGITDACGTGACATAVAARLRGEVPADAPIVVRLPGGALEVCVPSDPTLGVTMTGPARTVFAGSIAPGSIAR